MDLFISRGAWLYSADAADPAAEQRRRHLHRRHREGRAARPGQFHLLVLGRLRQRRLARRLHRLRAADATACITTEATAPSRKSRARPACRATADAFCKGATWIDYDNDDYPDLFVDNLNGTAQLYHNNRNGTFTDVTESMGIDGPQVGFSCWAWDYDNDGWLDIFATCYDHSVGDVVKGLLGQPHKPIIEPALPQRERQGSSRTRPRKPGWTWSSPRWEATSATSTTTASSTSTWAPATPT